MDLYGGAGPPVKWLLVYKTHEYYNKILQVSQTRVNGALGCKCVHAYITLHCISLHCIALHTQNIIFICLALEYIASQVYI